MCRSSLVSVCLVVFALPTFALAQNQSDPQALAFAAQSITAMVGNSTITDVTLTGNVTWTGSGTPESGTATLLALGTSESRMNLALPTGTRTEIRDSSTGLAQGEWIAESGASGAFSPQNTLTDAAWFFPALGSLTAGSSVLLSYVGAETRNGESVQHLQSYLNQSGSLPAGFPSVQQLSTIDFYLDASTFLPSAVVFNAHPDNDANSNLVTEIDFSNYQMISGVNVPTRIQKTS